MMKLTNFPECMNLHLGMQDSQRAQRARTLEQTNKQLVNSKK